MGQCICGNKSGPSNDVGTQTGPSIAAGAQARPSNNTGTQDVPSNDAGIQAGPSNDAGIQAGPSNDAGIQAAARGDIPHQISRRRLRNATNKFNVTERIGEGRTAIVYRGQLEDDQLVAVKRLNPGANRNKDYDREMEMLTRVRHPNIINLFGFCTYEDNENIERIVVYEYMPLRSLRDWLHARKAGEGALDWDTRMRIGAGVAKGLNYLHNEPDPRVIFGDLKPADVLLGRGFHPKISDFGAAINIPPESETSTVKVRSADRKMTDPYWAPEAVIYGLLSPKSDVYSFGMLLLEIIIRTLPRNDKFPHYVADRVRVAANFVGLADQELEGQFEKEELMKAMALASLCIHKRPADRPDMGDVVRGMDHLAGEPNAEWPIGFNVALEE